MLSQPLALPKQLVLVFKVGHFGYQGRPLCLPKQVVLVAQVAIEADLTAHPASMNKASEEPKRAVWQSKTGRVGGAARSVR